MEEVWKRRTVRIKDSEYREAMRILREKDAKFSQWIRGCVRALIADEKKRTTASEKR